MGTESTSRQNLTLEEASGKKAKGWFVKPATALFLLALALAAVIAVGLIVWFAAPREKCPQLTDAKRKETCERYIKDNGAEALCGNMDQGKKESSTEKDDKKDKKKEVPTGIRLNDTIVPSHYNLELWPRLYYGDDFGFNGTVEIFAKCEKDTDVIILHVDEVTVHNNTIEIRDVTGNTNSILTVNRTEEDTSRQFYKIYTGQMMMANTSYIISMSFNGTLIHPDWRGLYRSSYTENKTLHWLVSTQFETTHARRAFPCFDEPALKATFDVTLVRRNNFTSISNMPIKTTEDRGDGWEADIYERTVVMPTYLLAFVVSQFTYVESIAPSGTRMRVWTRPTFIQYAEYANSISGDILKAFEDWTGIPYSLPKMDQIAVPDFAAGAMENWGLVTYRETALLFNPDYTAMSDKRWVASVIAHELAHQWFGNLVTCHWWDNIFLNEAFATYFGDMVGLHQVETDWKMDEFFIRRVQYIMNVDGKHDSQPVYVTDVDHHSKHRKAFHRITYYKGGSILRMIKYFLTEPTFQAAIRNYLTKYSYKTAEREDLYAELEKQAVADNKVTWDTTKVNLSSLLDTWIQQMSYPFVEVTDLRTGKLRVEQNHFRLDKSKNISHPSHLGEFIWDIPLTYITESALKNKEDPTLKWIHRDSTIEFDGLAVDEWKLVNLYEQGFYRVKYDAGTWGALVNQLMTDHMVFPVENRAELLDDAFNLASAGEFDDLEALRATQYMYNEEEYLPWIPAVRGRTGYYLDMFYGTPAYSQLEMYLMNLTIPMYNKSGWEVSEQNDNHLDRYTRSIVIGEACARGYNPCINKARALFDQFMKNPNNNPIHPDLRAVVYCVGLKYGGNQEWEFLRSLYQKDYGDVYIAYENSTVSGAIGCAQQTQVVRTVLDFAVDYNLTSVFSNVAGNRHAQDAVWNYIRERWDDFQIKNESKISRSSILNAISDTWNSDWDLKELESFISTHNTSGLNSTIDSIKKRTKKNMEWVDQNMEKIGDWLRKVNSNDQTQVTSESRKKRALRGETWRNVAAGYSDIADDSIIQHRASHTI